jgi:hypothetical protein
MAEVSVFTPPKEFEDQFTHMRFYVDKLGRTSFRGVKNSVSTPVGNGERRVIEAFGHAYGEVAEPVDAIWHRGEEEDIEVTINGSYGIPKEFLKEDKSYNHELLKAEGRDEGIPRSQLEWKKKEDDENKGGEDESEQLKSLRNEIDELRQEMQKTKTAQETQLKELREELTAQIKQAEDARDAEKRRADQAEEDLRKANRRAKKAEDDLADANSRAAALGPEVPERWRGENLKAEYNGRVSDGWLAQTIVDPDGTKHLVLTKGDRIITTDETEVEDWQSQDLTESDQVTDNRFRRSWNRLSGRIGRRVYREEITEDSVLIDGYTERERRVGGVVGGLATLAAVATLIAGGLIIEELQDPNDDSPAITQTVTQPPATTTTVEKTPPATTPKPAPKENYGAPHTVTFNGSNGFKVVLPGNLKWEHLKKGYKIVDTAGQPVVPHVEWRGGGYVNPNTVRLIETTPNHHFKVTRKKYPYFTQGKHRKYHYHWESVISNS